MRLKDGMTMSKWIKLWLMGLFGALMLTFSAVLVYANTENTSPGIKGVENIERRTENSKTFQNPDGGTSVFVSIGPLHYKDAKGKWQDINTELEASSDEADDDGEKFKFKSVKNTLEIYLPEHSGGWTQVRSGKYRVGFKLVSNDRRSFTKRNDGIEANELFNNCDLKLSVGRGVVKEDIILKNTEIPKSFEYLIRLRNLDIVKQKDGSFLLRNEKRETVYIIPKFVMYDSNHRISEEVVTRLEKQGQGYRLIAIPNQSWLNDPKRAFPVVVDPTITKPPVNSTGILYKYYIPSQDYLLINPPPDNVNSTENSQSNILWKGYDADPPYGLPYDTHIKFTVTVSGDGPGPSVRIVDWDPRSTDDTNSKWFLADILPPTNVNLGSYSKEFTLQKGHAARLEMRTSWGSMSGIPWCGFTITYQKETMSPKAPIVKPLPPETLGNSVTLNWSEAIDEYNQDAWNQPGWNQITSGSIASLKETPKIEKYIVQYATEPNFSSPITFSGSVLSTASGYTCTISGLVQGTYYFRIYGVDDDGNPTNLNVWDKNNNPSGPRWSTVVTTKCIFPVTQRVNAVASSVLNSSSNATNVIDGNNNTIWSSRLVSWVNGGSPSPEWIYIDFGSPTTFNCIRLYPSIQNNSVYCFPIDFKFQTSNVAATWTDIPGQNYSNYPIPANCEQVFNLNSNITARYLKLLITKFNVVLPGNLAFYSGYAQIAEINVDMAPLVPVLTKPNILSVFPSTYINSEDRDYCNTGTPQISWDQTSKAMVYLEDEVQTAGIINNYSTTSDTPGNSITINPVPDGNYIAFIKIFDDMGNWAWSDGRRISIDTVPPSISSITESVNGTDVKLKFTSSEPVQIDVYWDLSSTPVKQVTNYIKYDGTDNTAITLPNVYTIPNIPHYYRIEVRDKATNAYSTGTIQLGGGPGTNVINTDRNFGRESYWNYQTIDLGRAGTAAVNLNNGNLTVTTTDFSIPGRGISLAMNRFYNSLTDMWGMLGIGWRTSFEMDLEISGQDVIINDPDGSSHKFTFNGSGYTRPAGDFRRLILNTDQSYTVIEINGVRYNFGVPQNGKCRLNSIIDRYGNTLSLYYDPNTGFLASVTEPSGRITANFEYNYYDPFTTRNLLSRIFFTPLESGTSQSRYMTFNYQGGRLTEVRYPTDKTGNNRIEAVVSYTYDSVVGVLSSTKVCLKDGAVEQENSRKNDTLFGYKPTKRSIGVVSTYFTNLKDGIVTPVKYFFDYNGNTTTFTDPRGNKFNYLHYSNGQCQSIVQPDCKKADGTVAVKPATTYFTYNEDYHLKTLTQQKDVYNSLVDRNEVRNMVITYSYDSNTGNMTSMILDDGDLGLGCKRMSMSIDYEPEHNGVLTDIKSLIDARGNTTIYNNTYDNSGKLTQLTIIPPITDPSSSYTIIHTFNQYGERIDKNVNTGNPQTRSYHFGYGYQNGLLSSLTNVYGSTAYYYTLYGERKEILDANSVKTDMVISDYTGYLRAVNAPEETASIRKLTDYLLSGNENRLTYDYDANGNKTVESDSKGTQTWYSYNELNQLASTLTATIKDYNYYDQNGNLIKVEDNNQKHLIYVYDEMNRRIQVKDYFGNVQEEQIYDCSNRVAVRYDGYKITNGYSNRTEYYYDSLDNLICAKHYNKLGIVSISKYSYDANGNILTKEIPISAKDETGTIITNYQYDLLNRPSSINTSCATNSKYNQTVNYTYEAGQLKTMTVTANGGNSQTYLYHYDDAMRLDYMTNQAGQKFTFDYFPGGQRKKKSAYKQSSDESPFMTVDYTYDEAYLLRNLEYKWGSDSRVALNYNYDIYCGMDKITDNKIDYHVNSPAAVNYLLAQLPDNNKPAIRPLLNGSITNRYSYDNLGRMISSDIYGINPGLKSNPYPLVYQKHQQITYSDIDPNGNARTKITACFDENNRPGTTVTENSTLNALNQIISKSVNITGAQYKNYLIDPLAYDDNGNLLNEHYTDGRPIDSQYLYGLDDQLLWNVSETKHQSNQDSSNNYIDCYNRSEKWYTYELEGSLRRAKTIFHDSTDPNHIKDWNYNDFFYYSHDGVVAELHDDSNVLKYYTRLGNELFACNNDNGSGYFYIQNIRGDVMMLVSANGDVESIRDYDADGQVISQAPLDRDPFGFTGGLDAGNGLWKLGARFYDSSKNSFIQQDRYMGDPGDPLSLNRYVYCGLDPVNFVDPTGFTKAAIYHFSSVSQQKVSALSTRYSRIASNLQKGAIASGIIGFGGAFFTCGLAELGGFAVGTFLETLSVMMSDTANNVADLANASYFTISGPDRNGEYNIQTYSSDGKPLNSFSINSDTYNAVTQTAKMESGKPQSDDSDDSDNSDNSGE
jgi:RHS repeat-associated protein